MSDTSFLRRFRSSLTTAAPEDAAPHVCVRAYALYADRSRGLPSGAHAEDRNVRDAVQYWSAAFRAMSAARTGRSAEEPLCGAAAVEALQRSQDLSQRYRILQHAVCSQHVGTGSQRKDCAGVLRMLDSTAFEPIARLVLPVVVLTVDEHTVELVLCRLLQSSLAAKHFANLAGLTGEVFTRVLDFLMEQICSENSAKLPVLRIRCQSLVLSIASSSSAAAKEVLAYLSNRATRNRNDQEHIVSADMFCRILKECFRSSSLTDDLYAALFWSASKVAGQPARGSCLFCAPQLLRSHWLLNNISKDRCSQYLDNVLEILQIQVALLRDGDAEEEPSTDGDQVLDSINKTCTVFISILLYSCSSKKGAGSSPGFKRLAESVHDLVGSGEAVASRGKSCFPVLRRVISLLSFLLIGSDPDDPTIPRLLASAVKKHFLQCQLKSADEALLLGEKYYSFYLRATLALRDGRGLCRVGLHCLRPSLDFTGSVSCLESGNIVYNHLCDAYETVAGGRFVHDTRGIPRCLSPEACRAVLNELAPDMSLRSDRLIVEFRHLFVPPTFSIGGAGDRLWCIELLLWNFSKVCKSAGNESGPCDSVSEFYSHQLLSDIITFKSGCCVPHERVTRAVTAWFSFRAKTLDSRPHLLAPPLPLLHHELAEFMTPVNGLALEVDGAAVDCCSMDGVDHHVVEFSLNRSSRGVTSDFRNCSNTTPNPLTIESEMLLANEHAEYIVDSLFRDNLKDSRNNRIEGKEYNTAFGENHCDILSACVATYTIMTQSCAYRYSSPITNNRVPSPGDIEKLGDFTPWVVHVMSESPFEFTDWGSIPFRLVFRFLAHYSMNNTGSSCRSLLLGIVSMSLKLCPEILLGSPMFHGDGLFVQSSVDVEKRQRNKDEVLQLFLNIGIDGMNESSNLECDATKLLSSVYTSGMVAEEISVLAVMCCRNIVADQQRRDLSLTGECESAVGSPRSDTPWVAVWEALCKFHPSRQSVLLQSLNCLIDVDEFLRESIDKSKTLTGIDVGQHIYYSNVNHIEQSYPKLKVASLSNGEILNCSRVVRPRIRCFQAITKEPMSLVRCFSPSFLTEVPFCREVVFTVILDQVIASRVLARRCVWNMNHAHGPARDGGVIETGSAELRDSQALKMHSSYVNMQEVIVARLLVEIVSSCRVETDGVVGIVRKIFDMNASLLPLYLFYFDDFISEREITILMQRNNTLLFQCGALILHVISGMIGAIEKDSEVNPTLRGGEETCQLLDHIVEIKRFSLGPLTWSTIFLNLVSLYFNSVRVEVLHEKRGSEDKFSKQCDTVCSMFGAFIFKCIMSFSVYHECDIFLSSVSRAYLAIISCRPEMAAHPFLVISELSSVRYLGSDIKSFNGFDSGVMKAVMQGFPARLSDIMYLSRTEATYDVLKRVKSVLGDSLLCLQQALHDGSTGVLSNVTAELIAAKYKDMKQDQASRFPAQSRKKRARSIDSTVSAENMSSGGDSDADTSDSSSDGESDYSSSESTEDTTSNNGIDGIIAMEYGEEFEIDPP